MCNENYAVIRDMQQSVQDCERQITIWMKTAEQTTIQSFYANAERDAYKKIIREIIEAIENEGPVPHYHHHVMRKHRSEWPTLWKAIDKAIEKIND
jgi:hypothetical protein